MEKHSTEKSKLAGGKKTAFSLIIFPLVFAILLIVILTLTIFLNGGKNTSSLENWANISVILISLVFFLPGLFFLVILIAVIILLGKALPVIEQGLMKTQLLAVGFNNLISAFVGIALYPFSIVKVCTQHKKIEHLIDKESING